MWLVMMKKELPPRPRESIHSNSMDGNLLWAALTLCWRPDDKLRPSAAGFMTMVSDIDMVLLPHTYFPLPCYQIKGITRTGLKRRMDLHGKRTKPPTSNYQSQVIRSSYERGVQSSKPDTSVSILGKPDCDLPSVPPCNPSGTGAGIPWCDVFLESSPSRSAGASTGIPETRSSGTKKNILGCAPPSAGATIPSSGSGMNSGGGKLRRGGDARHMLWLMRSVSGLDPGSDGVNFNRVNSDIDKPSHY